MEGDAGAGRLTPTPATPDPEADDAERSEAEEAEKSGPVADDAERSEAEEAGDHGPATEDTQCPSRSRLRSRGWLVGVATTLILLSVALGAGGYAAVRANQHNEAVARAEAAALRAAKDCVTATQAPDIAAMVASQKKIIDCATGNFEAQAMIYSGILVDAYRAANAEVTVSDLRAAVERHNPDGSIDVLVALRVTTSNSQVQDQETGYRLRVQMAPDDGVYKIARLDQVTA